MKLSNKWISVDKQLPDTGQEVIACFRQKDITFIVKSSLNEHQQWCIDNIGPDIPNKADPIIATHWLPINDVIEYVYSQRHPHPDIEKSTALS